MSFSDTNVFTPLMVLYTLILLSRTSPPSSTLLRKDLLSMTSKFLIVLIKNTFAVNYSASLLAPMDQTFASLNRLEIILTSLNTQPKVDIDSLIRHNHTA